MSALRDSVQAQIERVTRILTTPGRKRLGTVRISQMEGDIRYARERLEDNDPVKLVVAYNRLERHKGL